MLAGLPSSAILENVNSQSFFPLQVRRESAWTSGTRCVTAEWWGHPRKGPRKPGDSWSVTTDYRFVTTLVLAILRKTFLRAFCYSFTPLLVSRVLVVTSGNRMIERSSIRHESNCRIGGLGWSTVGSLANSSMVSLLWELWAWEQHCFPVCSSHVQCSSTNNLHFKETALSSGSSKSKKR